MLTFGSERKSASRSRLSSPKVVVSSEWKWKQPPDGFDLAKSSGQLLVWQTVSANCRLHCRLGAMEYCAHRLAATICSSGSKSGSLWFLLLATAKYVSACITHTHSSAILPAFLVFPLAKLSISLIYFLYLTFLML